MKVGVSCVGSVSVLGVNEFGLLSVKLGGARTKYPPASVMFGSRLTSVGGVIVHQIIHLLKAFDVFPSFEIGVRQRRVFPGV